MPYQLTFAIDRTVDAISAEIATSSKADTIDSRITGAEVRLFQNVQVSLTVSASAGAGTSHVILTDFTLSVPHQRWWAVKLDDPFERVIVFILALLGLLLIAAAHGRRILRLFAVRLPRRPRIELARVPWLVLGAVAIYLVGNVLLFPLGSHPFDFSNEELYSYVAGTYGLSQLYYLPNLVSLAHIWSGVPFVESAFPYGATFGYLYGGLGWVSAHVGGASALGSTQILYLLKGLNVVFGLADSALIYAVLREVGSGRRWSLVGAGLFAFNPAVWFSMSVWGQTHALSIFFVLLSVLMIERNQSFWAWLALAAALMTRPQMLIFGFLLGIVLLRRFSVRVNGMAVAWTVITVFLLLLPFTLAIGPTLPVDVMLNNFRVQEAGGNASSLTTVSQSAYSIWPLITYLTHGASGLVRAFTPSSQILLGSLTYQRVGLILVVIAQLLIGGALALHRRESLEAGGYLPLVAVGVCSFLMLLTGIVATHFLLALPFLILCRRWLRNGTYPYVVVIWTISTLVPMWGDMGISISAEHSFFAPASNAATRLMINLYQWDRFITVSIVATLCALVWLTWLAFGRSSQERMA